MVYSPTPPLSVFFLRFRMLAIFALSFVVAVVGFSLSLSKECVPAYLVLCTGFHAGQY